MLEPSITPSPELLRRLQRHVAEHPDSPLFTRLVSLLLEDGRVEDALEAVASGLDHHAQHPTGRLLRAEVCIAMRRYTEARAILTVLARELPDGSQAAKRLEEIEDLELRYPPLRASIDEVADIPAENRTGSSPRARGTRAHHDEVIPVPAARALSGGPRETPAPPDPHSGMDVRLASLQGLADELRALPSVQGAPERGPAERTEDVPSASAAPASAASASAASASAASASAASASAASASAASASVASASAASASAAPVTGGASRIAAASAIPPLPDAGEVEPSPAYAEPGDPSLQAQNARDLDLEHLAQRLEGARIPILPVSSAGDGTQDSVQGRPDQVDIRTRPVTETLASIYAQQGRIDEAIDAYRILALRHPARADEFVRRIGELRGNRR